jgi:hypothetical protein
MKGEPLSEAENRQNTKNAGHQETGRQVSARQQAP